MDQLPLRPRNNFFPPNPRSRAELVSSIFKELVLQILEKVKHEPYFRWSIRRAKMRPKEIKV